GLEARQLRGRLCLDQPLVDELRHQRRRAVIAQATGVDAGRHEVVSQRVHLRDGSDLRGVAEVERVHALGEGRAARRLARPTRTFLPAALSARKGKARPAKFEPPPWHPTTTSGYSPASSICFFASCPITVWWRRTWFKTLPRA